jgi:(p)ppGpp synthase/HD superfamily hydrolase
MQAPQLTKIEVAIHLAIRAHCGQVDADGLPHIVHVMEVMLAVKKACETRQDASLYTAEELIVAAILHDCPEDSFGNPTALEHVDLARIEKMFGENAAAVVDGVTRRPEEPYRDFVYRAKRNPGSRLVKTADLLCNLGRSDSHPDENRRRHFLYKYGTALRVINTDEPTTWELASAEFDDGEYFVADPNGNRKKIPKARFLKLGKL